MMLGQLKVMQVIITCITFITFIFLITLSSCKARRNVMSNIKGLSLAYHYNLRGAKLKQTLEKKYLIVDPEEQPSSADILNYINEIEQKRCTIETGECKKNTHFTNADIAEAIVRVSDCFGLDRYVFSALIRQESRFLHGKAKMYQASGITQLTRDGIEEVNHQLGFVPLKKERRKKITYNVNGQKITREIGDGVVIESIYYFYETVQNCITPGYFWVSPVDRINQLMVDEKRVKEDQGQSFKEWSFSHKILEIKKLIVQDLDTAMIYGSTLLKVLLLINGRNRYTPAKNYYLALDKYNANDTVREFGPKWGNIKERHHFPQKILFDHVKDIETIVRPNGLIIYRNTLKVGHPPISCQQISCHNLYYVDSSVVNVRENHPNKSGKTASQCKRTSGLGYLTVWQDLVVRELEVWIDPNKTDYNTWVKIESLYPEPELNNSNCNNLWVAKWLLRPVLNSHLDLSVN